MIEFRSSIGQDSHRFETKDRSKPLILAGVRIPEIEGLEGNSDADVVFHALTNAISGISCVNILGAISDEMCLKQSIKDSRAYLHAAMDTLDGYTLVNISFSIECKRPHITPFIEQMRINIAEMTKLAPDSIGITATSGEGLTDFGKGLGIQVLCIITVKREIL
ncbi:MAG: 2-C-methyl-D-erythritol 2,4-cyclodiphosphate synthase [Saccharofermentanales bacterium]